MGVHGLTTYLRENRHVLSRTVQFDSRHCSQAVPIVVDAWSFIYEVVYCADLQWQYGGEYLSFARLVEQVVYAWIEVGLVLHFVFDGPYPPLKFPTLMSRITQTNIQSGLLFFRTSSAARSSPRFLREAAMLPPLSYSVCVDTLLGLASDLKASEQVPGAGALHVHFADEEGDPYSVALAGRLGAYVAGRDSDFVVLNAEGYLGYVPLDEMVWTVTTDTPWDIEGSVYSVSTSADAESASGEVDDDGFQVVRKGKGRKKYGGGGGAVNQNAKAGLGILPPEALEILPQFSKSSEHTLDGQLSLSFAVYRPSTLAAHLGIPVSLLPLLGALLGNDFTGATVLDDSRPPPATVAEIRSRGGKANLQRLFFERQLTLTQRTTRVASTLSSILAAALDGIGSVRRGKRGQKTIGSVIELIDAAVTALLLRPLDTLATGEREAIVERVAEATLQYAIPRVETDESSNERGESDGAGLQWISDVCPIHTPEACPLYRSLSTALMRSQGERGEDDSAQAYPHNPIKDVRARYVTAYRRGRLDPHVLDTLQTGTMWPRMFLEDPDKETVLRSVGRPVRMWTYTILDASVGLPYALQPEQDPEPEQQESGDDDELVDVVEEDSGEEDESRGCDPLARLRGALKQLDGSDDENSKDWGSMSQPQPPTTLSVPTGAHPKVITEYVRRGTRLAGEEVSVPSLAEMLLGVSVEGTPSAGMLKQTLPPQVWSDEMRRALLLRALASDCPSIAALPNERLLGVLAVRWVVRMMNIRAMESPGAKERIMERWTQAEARAALASLTNGVESVSQEDVSEPLAVAERHIQLVAQLLAALDAIEQLSQVLLLAPTISSSARAFSGRRCHELLSGRVALPEQYLADDVWMACVDGLEDAFAVPVQRKKRRKAALDTDRTLDISSAKPGQARTTARAKAGKFGLLADIQA